jgi:hypothetical protein
VYICIIISQTNSFMITRRVSAPAPKRKPSPPSEKPTTHSKTVTKLAEKLEEELTSQGTAAETVINADTEKKTEPADVVVGSPRVVSTTVVTGETASITVRNRSKGEKYSIKETTEMLLMTASIGNVADDIAEDGVIKANELFQVVTVLPQIPEAIKGANLIPKELSDLSKEEAEQLRKEIANALNLRHEKTQKIAQASLDVVLAFSRLVTEIKAAKSE